MPVLRFNKFSGEIPKIIPRLLPDGGSQYVENVRLDDGGLTPMREDGVVHSMPIGTVAKTIFKFKNEWLWWDNVVHAVPGAVADDRLYFTGDGIPKMRVNGVTYPIALKYPTTKVTASLSGAGDGFEITRLYVYTWVTSFGEESEPSPVSSEVLWKFGMTTTLSGFESPPLGRGITKQRIYRSQSAGQYGTELFFIKERDATSDNFIDNIPAEQFNEVIPSKDWNTPPDDLSFLTALPNGMMAGFSGKQLCFSEPYRPHAWPEKYRITSTYNIVGLGAYGNTVVAVTDGSPFIASGNSPEAMLERKIEVSLPCVNPRGIVYLGDSVAYPSNEGLVSVSNSGAFVATDSLFTRYDWKSLNPSTMIAARFNGRYFASYSHLSADGSKTVDGTLIIDLTSGTPFVLRVSFKADSFYYDTGTGALYYSIGRTIYEHDSVGRPNAVMNWKSKRVVHDLPVSFGAVLVERGDLNASDSFKRVEEANNSLKVSNSTIFNSGSLGGEINGGYIGQYTVDGDKLARGAVVPHMSMTIYADGIAVGECSEFDKPTRIQGRMAKIWEVEVTGSAEIEQITLATTIRELTGS